MGYLLPTLIAFILNALGVSVFNETDKAGCEPLVSSLFFLFGLFLLLWNLKLFPANLRSLWKCGAFTLNFFVATFIMEQAMNNFWFPLEASMFNFLPRIAEYEKAVLYDFGWATPGILSFLCNRLTHVFASYLMSIFFLVSVLHATRVINLHLLKCSTSLFMRDFVRQMRRPLKRIQRKLSYIRSKLNLNQVRRPRSDWSDSDECIDFTRCLRRKMS